VYLGNPSLPLIVPVEEALKKISLVLTEKNWKDFEIGTLKLSFVPYFIFTYHYYIESEKNGKKIIESSADGQLVLGGKSLKIENGLLKIISENIPKAISSPPSVEFEEKETQITKKTQDAVLQTKAAEFFKIPRETITVSSIKKILIPFYESFITLEENTYQITINALDGKLMGVEKVPSREKGFIEITKETLGDLKDPKAWLQYTKGLAIETAKFISGKNSSEASSSKETKSSKVNISFLYSKYLLLLIILLALFVIYISFFV
jgi:hypothetical protein